ncbi:MAG: hypothetical protein ACK40N_11980 [Meiothermus ruber]|jgi:hypothetical protein|uniref:hypothetical protein n=1 Tax=Meiothermus ruber TaxID=277 RepID=UPI00391A77AA
MPRKPPPDEIRLRAIGVTRLRPGEATLTVRVRGKAELLRRFEALSPEERGRVVEAGFSREGVKDG